MERKTALKNRLLKFVVIAGFASGNVLAQNAGDGSMQQGPLYGKDGFYLGCVVASANDSDSGNTFELDDTITETSCVELSHR